MKHTRETRRAGGPAGLGKLSFPVGIDNRRYPTKNTAVLAAGKSFWPTVEAYAAPSPYRDFILANTGVRPVLRALAGGRAP